VTLAGNFAVLLNFGFTCPFLAIVVMIAIFVEWSVWLSLIQRYQVATGKQEVLHEAWQELNTVSRRVVSIVFFVRAFVCTGIIYDIVAAEAG
jgi:hypothetical protein